MEGKEKNIEENNKYLVKRICSWCNKDMGVADFFSNVEGAVTNGICDKCLEKMDEELEKEKPA